MKKQEKLSTGKSVLIFLIPIVGLFVWLNNRKTNPQKAKEAAIIALAGACFDTAIFVVRKLNKKQTVNGFENEINTIKENGTTIII